MIRLLKLLASLPLPVSRALGRFIGQLNWYFSAKQKHFVRTNLEHCLPELSLEQRKFMAKQSMKASGQLVAELAATWLWPSEKICQLPIEVEGMEHLQSAFEKKTGVMILTPHLGNWELLFPFFNGKFPLSAMYKPARMKILDDLIKAQRAQNGGEVFPASARGVRNIIRALKQGKVTFILPDQEPAQNAGVFAPFFKQPAWTMTLPGRLYEKTGCELLFACVLQTEKGFRIIFRTAQGISQAMEQQDLAEAINLNMESLIRIAPEQYQWSYKRFYYQPDGQEQIYL